MEEEKKKRMEQKILQNDEKVRWQAKLWAAQYGDCLSELCTTRVQTAPGTTCAGTGPLLVTNHVVG